MDILTLIKKKRAVRKYRSAPVPKKLMDKILEAGVWGPSLHGFQPWRFLVVRDPAKIGAIARILSRKSAEMDIAARIILSSTSETIANAQVLVAVYDSGSFTGWARRINRSYVKFAKVAELSAIAASVQNMMLASESLGVGSCWLDAPLFCEKRIKRELGEDGDLLALLTFGYPCRKARRSARRPSSETIAYSAESAVA